MNHHEIKLKVIVQSLGTLNIAHSIIWRLRKNFTRRPHAYNIKFLFVKHPIMNGA